MMNFKQIEDSLVAYGRIEEISISESNVLCMKTYCIYLDIQSEYNENCAVVLHCHENGIFEIENSSFPLFCLTAEQFQYIEGLLKVDDFTLFLTNYHQYFLMTFKTFSKCLTEVLEKIEFLKNTYQELYIKYDGNIISWKVYKL